jgi:cell shape-determining protein MreC
MTYQIKHTNNKQWWLNSNFLKIALLSVSAVICFFVFNGQTLGGQFATTALAPFFKTGNYFYKNLFHIPKIFSDKNELLQENAQLLSSLEDMRVNEINYQSLKIENEQLRKELGLRPSKDSIPASIIARPPQTPLDSLVVDRGADDLVRVGDLVLVGGKVLIGRVAKVFSDTSTIALDSSSSSVSQGFLERTGEPLTIKGFGGGGMQVKVPIDFDILVGDKVILANSINYVVAVVGVVEANDSSGFKNILLSLPTDISKIQTVFIEHFISQ